MPADGNIGPSTWGAIFAVLAGAVGILWRASVVAHKDTIAQLNADHKDVLDRLTVAHREAVQELKNAFADQLRVAKLDKDEAKNLLWKALGMADKSVDFLKEQSNRIGGGQAQ